MSLNKTLIKYPEDLSGLSPFNLVQNERVIIPRTTSRHFAPKHGPFFDASIKLRTIPGNVPLVPGVDFKILLLDQLAKTKSGQNVSYIVAITNPAVYGEISFDYQTIGGKFSASSSALKQLIENLELDSRGIRFDDLLDLPVTFPPSFHLHRVADLYGWEDMVDVVLQIKALLENGNDDLFDTVDNRITAVVDEVTRLWNHLQVEVANRLYELGNSITTLEQDLLDVKSAMEADNKVLTALRVGESYRPVFGREVLLAGGGYRLTESTEFRLPNASLKTVFGDDLKIGDTVKFTCSHDQYPIITVFDPTKERIKFKKSHSTKVRCKDIKQGVAVYVAPSTWEIHA